jgi:hypothetical protein
MLKTTKILGLGLAGAGLLLTACEVPGGGEPPRTIVFPNPGEEPTTFSGFPATFRGTVLVTERDTEDLSASSLLTDNDVFTTTVGGARDLYIVCDSVESPIVVEVESDGEDGTAYCDQDGETVYGVDGATTVTIRATDSADAGLIPYVVHADVVEDN